VEISVILSATIFHDILKKMKIFSEHQIAGIRLGHPNYSASYSDPSSLYI